MSGTDRLLKEIGTIAQRHMRKQGFSYSGSIYQITTKAKIRFTGKVKKGQ